MLNRRPFRIQESHDDERVRIQERLDAMERDLTTDHTRLFTVPGSDVLFDPVGSAEPPSPAPASGAEMHAYLITDDGSVLAEIPCDEGAGILTIGRGKTAEIRVNDPYVHRLQAEIRWDESAGTHYLAHGGGENGTYVNQYPIQQPYRLIGGERLRFGKTNLVYQIHR